MASGDPVLLWILPPPPHSCPWHHIYVCQAGTSSDLGSAAAVEQLLPCSSSTLSPNPWSPPSPISSLYKPSSLKQLSQSSADSNPEPGIWGEGSHLCSHPLLISKWEEVLANRGNPFKGHLPSFGSEPLPERRVWGRTGRGCGRCSRGCAGGIKGSPQYPEEEPGTVVGPA